MRGPGNQTQVIPLWSFEPFYQSIREVGYVPDSLFRCVLGYSCLVFRAIRRGDSRAAARRRPASNVDAGRNRESDFRRQRGDPRSPNDAKSYLARGNAYLTRGQIDNALADFDAAVTLDPADAEIYFHRATARQRRQLIEQAIDDLTSAIRLRPDYAEAYHNRGLLFVQQEDILEAISDFASALKINPENAMARSLRESTSARLSELFRTSLTDSLSANRTGTVVVVQDVQKEIARQTAAIVANPRSSDAYLKRSMAYERLNDSILRWPMPARRCGLFQTTPNCDCVERSSTSACVTGKRQRRIAKRPSACSPVAPTPIPFERFSTSATASKRKAWPTLRRRPASIPRNRSFALTWAWSMKPAASLMPPLRLIVRPSVCRPATTVRSPAVAEYTQEKAMTRWR